MLKILTQSVEMYNVVHNWKKEDRAKEFLQALARSPEALMAQLVNMARNGTVPQEFAETVKRIVTSMPPSAKLEGLGKLIERLKKENSERWRLVVFITRRETQTTIQTFLESHGLKVGIINGGLRARARQHLQHHAAGHLRGVHCRAVDGKVTDGRARYWRHRRHLRFDQHASARYLRPV
jgi:ERCC4-related helicase